MKIQNISLIKNNSKLLNIKSNSKNPYLTLPSLPLDSVSFCADNKKLSDHELHRLVVESYRIKDDARVIMKNLPEVEQGVKDTLQSARANYKDSAFVFKLALKNLDNGGFMLSNGHYFSVALGISDETTYFTVDEYDQNLELVRTFSYNNNKPSTIMEYRDDGDGFKLFRYDTNTIEMTDVDNDLSHADVYLFENGEIQTVSLNVDFLSEPMNVGQCYIFCHGKLFSFATDSFKEGSSVDCDERFIFGPDGKVKIFYRNFSSEHKTRLSWDECYYFENSKLSAQTSDAKMTNDENGEEVLFAPSAIRLNDKGEYVIHKNQKFLQDEFGDVLFVD